MSKLFELAPEEIAVPLQVSQAGRVYRVEHRLRPPAAADWLGYEAALQLALEELPPEPDAAAPGYRLTARTTDAALALWAGLVRRVEGYGELPPSDGWQELIPLAHKEAAVRALTLVAPAEAAGEDSSNGFFPLNGGEVAVELEAARDGRAYPRLVHRFRSPTVGDEKTYRRLLAESLIVRGSRTPRALLPARLPGLIRLYDRLILGVEGYARGGQPLTASREAVEHMDAWHKRAAVQALFGEPVAAAASPASLVEEAE